MSRYLGNPLVLTEHIGMEAIELKAQSTFREYVNRGYKMGNRDALREEREEQDSIYRNGRLAGDHV